MNRRLAFLTKLLVLVSLILTSLPAGATETVCVVGSKRQVVLMRKCGMPCCAHKPRIEPRKAACCKLKAAPQPSCGIAAMSCHCETRYFATSMPAQAAVVKFSLTQLDSALLDSPSLVVQHCDHQMIQEAPVLGTDVDPPRKVPRTPVLGRAPPMTSV